MPELGKATYVVDIDSRKFDEGITKIRGEVRTATTEQNKDVSQLGDTWGKLTGRVEDNRRSVDRSHSSFRRMATHITAANQAAALLGKTLGLIKWPAIIAGVGLAGQGIADLAGGAVALTGALTPMIGAGASAANAYLALGQAMAVLKIAGINQLSQALHGSATALERIGPEGRKFVDTLKALNPEWQKLKAGVQDNLFGGMTRGLHAAMQNFDIFRKAMVGMAGTMGDLAAKAGKLFGSKAFGSIFGKVATENQVIVAKLGSTFLHLADAFLRVLVVARPLTNWLLSQVTAFGKLTDAATKSAEGQKKMATFFQHSKQTIQLVGDLLGNLGHALINVGSLGRNAGMSLFQHMDKAAKAFRDFTESAAGQSKIKQFFRAIMPPLIETGRLFSDLTKDILGLGLTNQSGLTQFIRMLRTDVLPVFIQLAVQTAKSFGPALTYALKNIALLFGDLGGSTGPLTLFVKGIGALAGGLHKLLNMAGPLKSLTVTILSIGAIFSAIGMAKFTSQLFGFSKGWDVVASAANKAKTALFGAAAGETAANAAGGKGAVGGGLLGRFKGISAKPNALAGSAGTADMFGINAASEEAAAGTMGGSLAALGAAAVPAAAAIALIGSAVLALKTNFLGIRDIISAVFKPLVDMIHSIGDSLDSMSGGKFGEAMHVIGKALGPIQDIALWLFKLIGFLTVIGALVAQVFVFAPVIVAIAAVTIALKGISIAIDLIKKVAGPVFGWLKGAVGAAAKGVEAAFGWIKNAASDTLNWIKGAWHAFWGSQAGHLVQVALNFYVSYLKTMLDVGKTVFNAIKSVAVGAWTLIKKGAQALWNVIKGVFNKISGDGKVFSKIASIAKAAWEAISSAASTAWGVIKDGANSIIGVVKKVAKFLGGAFSSAWDTIKGVFSDGVDAVVGFLNTIIDGINVVLRFVGANTISHIGSSGGDSIGSSRRHGKSTGGRSAGGHGGHGFAVGGKVLTPSYVVGEEAPQHPEYVLATNPAYRNRNVGLWMQAGSDLGVPGFAAGGTSLQRRGMDRSSGGAGIPGFNLSGIIGSLPSPSDLLPSWLQDAGAYVLSKVGPWMVRQAKSAGLHVGKAALHAAGDLASGAVGGALDFAGFAQGGKVVGASVYGGPHDSTSGTHGYHGDNLVGKMAFAELGMGHALGGLPYKAKLVLQHGGKSVTATKLDIGAGGPPVGGHARQIDLWYQTAHALGLGDTWSGAIKESAAGSGGHKNTKGLGTKTGGLALDPKTQKLVDMLSGRADVDEEYATRANTIGGSLPAPIGGDELYWLQAELQALFQLRNALITALAHLRKAAKTAIVGGSGKGISGGKSVAGKGANDPRVQQMVKFGLDYASKHTGYKYGGGHSSFAGPYDCSGFVSAILHSGGLISSPMTTDGLKTWGQGGPGELVTVGVRGSTGRNAHTMMRVGGNFFESGGSAGGSSKVSGWDGSFPIKRHPAGLARGGKVQRGVIQKVFGVDKNMAGLMADPNDPHFVGWGLAKGGKKSGGKKPQRPTQQAVTQKTQEIMGMLNDLQGVGSSMDRMSALPPIGAFGGRLLDVQSRISDLGGSATASDSALLDAEKSIADSLQKQLLVANLQAPVFQDFFSAGIGAGGSYPQFGGIFHSGGVVPGYSGQDMMIKAQGGEIVAKPVSAGGGSADQIEVSVYGDLITDRSLDEAIEVKVGGVIQKQISKKRRSIG